MGVKKSGLMLTVLLVSCVSAAAQSEENVDRVFYFSHAGTAQEIREIYYIILGMTEMRPQFVDSERKTLTLRGTAGQIALAEWLFNELDKPSNPQLPTQRNAELEKREFHLSGTPQQVARVFYPSRAGTVQELTELATLLRAIIDMRSVFTYNASRAIVARGTPAQVQLAEWLLEQLNNPANWQAPSQPDENPAKYEFRLSGAPEDVVRVFYLTHAQSAQDLTEIVTVVRAIGDIRRVFNYNLAKALVIRGTADQAGLAQWLCNGLNNPVNRQDAGRGNQTEVAHEYRLLNTPEDVVRVFYLTTAGPPQRLHDIATQVRSATQVRRLFIHSASKALAMRGTVDQIAVAGRLIHEETR